MNEATHRSRPIIPAERMKQLPKQFFADLVQRTNARIAEGHDVINLGQGNPDLPTAPHIVEALQQAAADPIYHRYPPFSGFSFLKEAVALRYKTDYDVDLDPASEVAVLFGGKTGLVEISQILLNPGDVCLVPDPGYPDYWSGVALAGAEMVMMPLLEQHGFMPAYDAIGEEHLRRAKLMFLNYPNNPTSAVASSSFYEETVRFAERHGIVVASDFAYGAIGFDGQRPVSFLETPGAKEVGIEFYTMSKTYNMAGWRVAFAVGNREIIRLINLMQDHMYVSLFGAVQAAAAAALTGPQDSVCELCAIYERRRDAFFEALRRIGWQVTPPPGSFFAWLPVPKPYSSAAFADLLLEKANVVVAPGIGFGEHGEGYVRVGLLAPEARLREAADRIGQLALF
ncbi:pyridoxal phosphate-dependent aminotransferase [Paenibacillus apiarius]|uniref:Pyridoxal phosphate-dependent aminotransferase n=1 Tax=Paenibacillus apiarius TaxID=46240 RepID=A0ABT4DXE0_9BACL|nr:pyridoxal phosphate-dependent aminotransferase [Paenibacillus apiarius]MCY9515828.1 pyridoxal phosphate-dependent aminotransferase [Paenibacillus apiarius]MCY9520738.1 pyridoxal phosphate-dependent aminotransferase [Paenibacillus apiarius]MCY9553442.1 pyridoxal phosphate-dependent aminotransferase [Paenibacillus apiarius]MCY9558034.1 pyridoxal phosphate-dependent aminotransferase [Paenibacillus apiarius]MCY9685889.1 pyridoxal phosphate-dependent aminotransferase [Paenibacillus apiarius]